MAATLYRLGTGLMRLVCYDCNTMQEVPGRWRVNMSRQMTCESCGAESGSGAVTVTEEQLVNILNYLAAKAQNADRWVNGCGGTETPFVRHGVRYLWCYNHATGKSGYLNLDTDMIVDHDEIVRMLSSGN